MRRVAKWLLAIVIVLGVVFVAGAYILPGEVLVQRSIKIEAPPEKVFAIVGNLRRGNEFSPWVEIDPATKFTFEGPESGVGQKMTWQSAHPDVGNGAMTVTEYVEGRRVATELDLGEMGKARSSFELSPSGSGTDVTWGFKADLNNPLERWLSLLVGFDRLIGNDYEKGLAKLKTVAEKDALSQ